MSSFRPRVPAWTPPPAREGKPWADDPAPRLEEHFRRVRQGTMAGMPFLNEALAVAALPFARVQGDWVGIVLTPWFLHVYLLPGGGELWQDLAQGLRRQVQLPAGTMDFIGDEDEALGPLQYCVLMAPVPQFASQDEALAAAREALGALLTPPPAEVASTPAATVGNEAGAPAATAARTAVAAATAESAAVNDGRRGFLRGILGRP